MKGERKEGRKPFGASPFCGLPTPRDDVALCTYNINRDMGGGEKGPRKCNGRCNATGRMNDSEPWLSRRHCCHQLMQKRASAHATLPCILPGIMARLCTHVCLRFDLNSQTHFSPRRRTSLWRFQAPPVKSLLIVGATGIHLYGSNFPTCLNGRERLIDTVIPVIYSSIDQFAPWRIDAEIRWLCKIIFREVTRA